MKEKDLKYSPKPQISDVLHPEIGNGVALSDNNHSFALRAPDPTKAIEQLLPENITTAKKAEKDIIPIAEDKSAAESTSKSNEALTDLTPPAGQAEKKEELPSQTSADTKPAEKTPKVKVTNKKAAIKTARKKTKKASEKSIEEQLPKDMRSSPQEEENKEATKKAPKPGKRIRKAAKAVQKQKKEKEETAQKPVKKKATKKPSTKKAAVKPAATKKSSAKKTIAAKTPAKKVSKPKAVKKAETENLHTHLSPFTQWLKDLGGADYVHPYDDDFALKQEKGALTEVISETYANLLAAQGYKERAIAMYLKLIEKYPEKSSFFAAKIEALQ